MNPLDESIRVPTKKPPKPTPSRTVPPRVAPPARPAAKPRPGPQASLSFRPIHSSRAFEEIANQIRNEVIAGRLKVGSRLSSERALAEQFGVSRNTLREALRSLEHVGLIRLQTGASGGAFISERSGDAIVTGLLDMYHLGAIQPADLTEARIWLESVIVREACTRATPDDLAALHRNIDEAAGAFASGDFPLRARKHLEFHRILTGMTGNPVMVILMSSVLEVLQHFINTIGDYPNAFVLPSRRRFLKHMEEGDIHGAVEEMEASLKRLQRSYLSQVNVAPVALPTRRGSSVLAAAERPVAKPVAKRPTSKRPVAPAAAVETAPAKRSAVKTASTKRVAAKPASARRDAVAPALAKRVPVKSASVKRVVGKPVSAKRAAIKPKVGKG